MRAVSEAVNEGQSQAGASEGAEDQGAEGGAAAATEPPLPLGVKKQRKSLGSFFKKQSQDEDDLPLTEEQKVESELERANFQHLLDSTTYLPDYGIITAYRRNKNIRDLLVRAKLRPLSEPRVNTLYPVGRKPE
ncbi:unnamed protein product [Arctogadus glacialis]